jgi:opacity protein-like surface antigen
MKKALVLLVVSFLIAGSSFAQVKISGGVLGGLNLANATIDPTPSGADLSNLTGFGVGGVLNFDFAGGIGLHFEPMYIQNGVKLSSGTLEEKFKANYIEVPAIVTYTFATGEGQVEPYIMAGPVLGIRLSAKLVDPTGAEADYKDNIKSTNFGGTFGAGVKVPVGMNTIFVEGRYTIGFTNINNFPGDNTTIKTKNISFFAGITFPFGS